MITGEAKFIRAASYYFLFNLFGPTPIIEIPAGSNPEQIEEIGKATPRARYGFGFTNKGLFT